MSRSISRVAGTMLAVALLGVPALPAAAAAPAGTTAQQPAASSVAGPVRTAITTVFSDACIGTPLRYGSHGSCVAELQSGLNRLYGLGLVADGSYGPATTRAVRWFQARVGLTVDGRCGPQTWGQLLWAAIQYDAGLDY